MNLNSRLAGVLVATTLSAAAFAQTYNYQWNEGDGGANNAGGVIKQLNTSYDTGAKSLSWSMTFGEVPSSSALKTDGFWMVVSNGPNPKNQSGQLAIFYMDASNPAPVLTVYAYNGVNGDNSYKDGSIASGTQAPDRIASSKVDNGFIESLSVVTNPDGTRTLGFKVKTEDSTQNINGHSPLHPGPDPWEGAQFGEKIGIWVHPTAGTVTDYYNSGSAAGFLKNFAYQKSGWLDLENKTTTVVPEPATLAVLGLGAAAALRRRRK